MADVNGAAKEVSFSALKPQLAVASQKAEEAVQFYKAAFGAEEVSRTTYPKRKADQELPLVLCAELKIGGSAFLVCDQAGDPAPGGGLAFRLETDDVEGAMMKAVSAGAAETSKISEDEEGFCGGGVVGKVEDPFGVVWTFASVGKKRCGEPQAA